MLADIFSPGFSLLLTSADSPGIENIPPDLVELAVAGTFALTQNHLVWVVGENENLKEKKEKLLLWLRLFEVETGGFAIVSYMRPFEDPYINKENRLPAAGEKAGLVAALQENKRLLVLTTRSALCVKIEQMEQLDDFFLTSAVDDEINREELWRKLLEMGYRSRNIVEEPGDIARRGSIVDVYPVSATFAPGGNMPVRIEIEAEMVVSIRQFHPDTQKSIQQLQQVSFPMARFFSHQGGDNAVNPAYGEPGTDENQPTGQSDTATSGNQATTGENSGVQQGMVYLTELLKDYKLILSDPNRIDGEFQKLLDHYWKIYDIAPEKERQRGKPGELLNFPLHKESYLAIAETYDDMGAPPQLVKLKHSLMELDQADIGTIKDKIENSAYTLHIFTRRKEVAENLSEHWGNVHTLDYEIPFSFENPETRHIFLTHRHFRWFNRSASTEISRELKSTKHSGFVKEIAVDDLVVHKIHGIGRFVGFQKLGIGNEVTEFLKLGYLNDEYLYVPVYELDVLAKYTAFEGGKPRLDKMGGSSWRSKQNRAQKSIVRFAGELLQLYAKRKAVKGSSFSKDFQMEEQLVREFGYVETLDQKRAIKEVLGDLEAEYPMDRLICGDVSFGKTEVAVRAAFRVIAGGKQAAVLCPTTILAFQHYSTFKKRFASFPVNIAMLSRMVSAKEKKRILAELEQGRIDIVIGTHALISKGVVFRDLGLYVIDEEQRFGVFQKEKLKKDREHIDALSLSATPIPRTLSLSMAGLQDISIITTPPIGRIAVKNYVGWFSREIVVSAVLNEIERDGSVFIIYNNIDKIYTFQEQLKEWLPDVETRVIHARMKGEAIEKILMDFINKKYKVLISTTIIENGIDIPHVNTLLVLDADRFGLTQLYQLRGRIGRGNRQGYAYFLIKSPRITHKAKARLEAIREFAQLGSGFKLAEFDLELRGAGSLLGNKQHGHIEALGFEYYHNLLNNTVKELQGKQEQERETKIKINFSYSIDPAYIPDSSERIAFYRRILDSRDIPRLQELRMELSDRYGRFPPGIEKIFFTGLMRVLARRYQFEEMELFTDSIEIRFAPPGKGKPPAIGEFLEQVEGFGVEVLSDRMCRVQLGDFRDFMKHFLAPPS
ncbi:MAG: transcription-repair coupling factor [bacterium]|nr:transcription-repair coupling factor [bacterium]